MRIILGSGLEVTTADKSMERRIINLLLDIPAPEKKRRQRRILGRRKWSQTEDVVLRERQTLNPQERLELARLWGRTPNAVNMRFYNLKKVTA